jgi:hypothetical protein
MKKPTQPLSKWSCRLYFHNPKWGTKIPKMTFGPVPFAAEALPGLARPPGKPLLFGEQLYWLPATEGRPFAKGWLHGLKVLRTGLHLAEVKGRVEPAHALALALP